ncbi:FHA domain-containing protein [Nitratireductor sp. ZSWI3]|uniref:SctD/MshK family protein n=1 Tax=Nitratireductor sp. ZSWI3 TaxID=2966359 RepID=UPI00214FCBCA|nr:FHA domain-containing protein [Nitratireductor sp. ZSWI3]MCR4264821.1 hypothetical protein [Nitratireductor sp. ZSWI3]
MNPRVAKLVRELPDMVRTGMDGFGRRRLGWRRAAKALPAPAQPVFEVLQGAHSGATLHLDDASYTIGSGTEADILLSDEGIADLHTRLHIRRGRVEIEATGGPVKLGENEIVPMGHGRRCKLPLDATLGEARFRIVGSAPESVATRLPNSPLLAFSGIFLAIFVGFVASNSLSRAEPETNWPKENAGVLAMLGLGKTGSAGQQAAGEPAAKGLEGALDQLARRLEQAGISGVNVALSDDRLIASGTVSKTEAGAWKTVRSWFDQTYGGRVLLVSDVTTGDAAQMPRIRLQAIWYGAQPYIIAADGTRYHEGAFVSGGWTISEIGETQLVLKKAGDTVALKYQ